jgi:hypothetical protein
VIVIPIVLVVGIVAYIVLPHDGAPAQQQQTVVVPRQQYQPIDRTVTERTVTEPTLNGDGVRKTGYDVIGYSVENREIRAYHIGTGKRTIVLLSGMHGGYSWNTVILAFQMIDYLAMNPSAVPSDLKVVVIPVANPDGLYKVVGTSDYFGFSEAPQFAYSNQVNLDDVVVQGRFNAHGVDLNRNFGCGWSKDAVWLSNKVSPGTSPFSEPESQALRDYFLATQPVAVVVYHSASDGVYASFCNSAPSAATTELLKTYGDASGYPQYSSEYPYYHVSGDVADWLASKGIPAVSVELVTHDSIEWDRNLPGLEAMMKLYSDQL